MLLFALRIREPVEAEEKEDYKRRMRKSWIKDLSSTIGAKDERLWRSQTSAPQQPFPTEAPAPIAVFKQIHTFDLAGQKIGKYCVNESCSIAARMLV